MDPCKKQVYFHPVILVVLVIAGCDVKPNLPISVVQIDFWACSRSRCDSQTPHPGHRYFQIINDWLNRKKLNAMQIGSTGTENHTAHQSLQI